MLVNNVGIGADFGVAGTDPDFEAIQRTLDTKLLRRLPADGHTDVGGPAEATKSIEDGASGVVWLATLPDHGPTGGFFGDGQPVAF